MLKKKLIEYLDQTVEPKLISYEPVGDEFRVQMRDKTHPKTTEDIAKDIIDIFWREMEHS